MRKSVNTVIGVYEQQIAIVSTFKRQFLLHMFHGESIKKVAGKLIGRSEENGK